MNNDYLKEYQEIIDKMNRQEEINRSKPLTDDELLLLIWYNKCFERYQEKLNMKIINKESVKFKRIYIGDYEIKKDKKEINILNDFVIEYIRKNNMNACGIITFNPLGERKPNESKIYRNINVEGIMHMRKNDFNTITREYYNFRADYIQREYEIKSKQEYDYVWFDKNKEE